MVLQLLHQWREAGGGESFPRLEEIDQEALGDIWHDCYVLTVGDALDDVSFQSIGKVIAEGCDEDFTGRLVSDVPEKTLLYQSASQSDRVLRRSVPISMGGRFDNLAGQTVLYRSIVLPLSDGSDAVKQLLGAANCRIVTEG